MRPSFALAPRPSSSSSAVGDYSDVDGNGDYGDDTDEMQRLRASIGDNDVDDDDGAPMSGETEDLVPIIHPELAKIQRQLGRTSECDEHCFMCEQLAELNPDAIAPEIKTLQQFIESRRTMWSDKVVFSRHVQRAFETLVRVPGNSREAGRIKEWTLRSIYEHITEHDGTLLGRVDRNLDRLERIIRTTEQQLYYALRQKVLDGGTTQSTADTILKSDAVKSYKDDIKTLNATIAFRRKLEGGETFSMSGPGIAAAFGSAPSSGASRGLRSTSASASGRGGQQQQHKGTSSMSLSTFHAPTISQAIRINTGNAKRNDGSLYA